MSAKGAVERQSLAGVLAPAGRRELALAVKDRWGAIRFVVVDQVSRTLQPDHGRDRPTASRVPLALWQAGTQIRVLVQ